jgi:SAM-dependent methyltransferase
MPNKLKSLVDKKQEVFNSYEVSDPIRIKKVIKVIKKYFGEVTSLNILECGITKGGVADKLSKENAHCFGVDVNPRELKGVKLIQSDLNNGIPDFGVKFDVIFAGEIIEHLFDENKFICECHKSLKSGGILIITVPNLVSLSNRRKMFFGFMPSTAYVDAPFHYHIYNKNKLKDLVKSGGFAILKQTSSYIPFYKFSGIPGAKRFFGFLGDLFPALGNQLIIFGKKK